MLRPEQPTALASRVAPWKALDSTIRHLLAGITHRIGKQVMAERMSESLGRRISVSMLSDFASESKAGARFPIVYVEAFCRAAGDDTLKRLILGPELREMLELGERAAEILDDRVRRRVLKVPGNGSPAVEKRNGKAACAR